MDHYVLLQTLLNIDAEVFFDILDNLLVKFTFMSTLNFYQ